MLKKVLLQKIVLSLSPPPENGPNLSKLSQKVGTTALVHPARYEHNDPHPLVRVTIANTDLDEEVQRNGRVHQVDRHVSFSVSLDSFLVEQLVSKVWPEAPMVEVFPRACHREVFDRAYCHTEIQQPRIGLDFDVVYSLERHA